MNREKKIVKAGLNIFKHRSTTLVDAPVSFLFPKPEIQ